jgi:hypothetical protein
MTYLKCEGADWAARDYHQAEPDAPDHLCAACRKAMLEAETKRPASWGLFAMKRGDHFEHFYPSTTALRMCGSDPMFLVCLMPDDAGAYWGWYHSFHPSNRSDKGRISMVYRHRAAVEMCFAYGHEEERKRGRGEIIRLHVEPVRPAMPPEAIR